jgi:ribosomal-protein-alanine N-acetyltransferase
MFLETARTNIRPFIQEDLDKLLSLCCLPEVMHYMPPHFSPENKTQVRKRLNDYINHHKEYGISFCHVANKKGEFIGRAGYYFVPEVNLYEICYALLPQYWGKGYATELVHALLDYAFHLLNLDTVCARTLPGNTASENVLLKTGFTALGERAFPVDGRMFLWNYFEYPNDDSLNLISIRESYTVYQ